MGTECSCQKIECEEETFMRIFSSMNLTEIEAKSVYAEFNRCLHKEDGYLDYFLFRNFLNKIVGDNIYKNAQIAYFENLRRIDNKKQNIKKIGSLIIFLSKGTKFQKIELLHEHYITYYILFDERTVKEFINDLIDVHTDNCLVSFRENLDPDTVVMMNEVYKKIRKRQLLYHVYLNFDRVKIKYFVPSPKATHDNLNTSFDVDELNDLHDLNYVNDLIAVDKIQGSATRKKKKEEFPEVYERYTKNQLDPIRNQFTLDSKKFNQEEKVIKEFIELAFNHLNGEYMRNWLYEDYIKEKSFDNVCI